MSWLVDLYRNIRRLLCRSIENWRTKRYIEEMQHIRKLRRKGML